MLPPTADPQQRRFRQRLRKNARFLLGFWAGRYALPTGLLRYFPAYRPRLVTPQTDLCIEGFFRSANTFFVTVFRRWNPGGRYAHHIHLPGQVLRALRYDRPALVLLRAPDEAVASLLVMDENLDIGTALWCYRAFYRSLLPHRRRFVTGAFREAVETPEVLVQRVNEHFGTDFHQCPLSDAERTRILDNLRRRVDRQELHPRWLHVPSAEKEERKAVLRERIRRHRRFPAAQVVYDAMRTPV